MKEEKVRIRVRLTKEENQKLEHDSAQIPRRQAGAAFGHILQRRGHPPRADPGGDGRSLPAQSR